MADSKEDSKPEAPESEKVDAKADVKADAKVDAEVSAKADAKASADTKDKAATELLTPAQVSYENLDVDPVDAEWDLLPVQKRHYADGEPAF